MVPLAAALYLGTSMFRQASAIWFNPEIGEQLDRGVDVYKDYVKAIKDDLKHQTVAIAADPGAPRGGEAGATSRRSSRSSTRSFPSFPELVSLAVEDAGGQVALARRDRGRPVDAAHGAEPRGAARAHRRPGRADARRDVRRLEASASTSSRAPAASSRATTSSRRRAPQLYQGYLNAFALLLGITLAHDGARSASSLARGVTRRINRLGAAINLVAQGDLSVRVPVTGSDELTDLAKHVQPHDRRDGAVARAHRVPAARSARGRTWRSASRTMNISFVIDRSFVYNNNKI